MKVVFASSNSDKTDEIRARLKSFNVEIIPQIELDVQEIPETGLTFVENALLKARHACRVTGFPAIADDSGLEVKALHGAPGIYSSRYSGDNSTEEQNINKLLETMKDIPDKERFASFRCVLVYLAYAEDPAPLICQGTWHGTILHKPQGEQGFGYDPIFFDPKKHCSAAQLGIAVKNEVSHRGKALRLLLQHLPEKLEE